MVFQNVIDDIHLPMMLIICLSRSQFANESGYVPQNGYYSVDVPGAHIISLNQYVPWGNQSQQYNWLTQDLASGMCVMVFHVKCTG